MDSEEQLLDESIQAIGEMLNDVRLMSTLWWKLRHSSPKNIRFGLKMNKDIINALGDLLNAHDAVDDDLSDDVNPILERMAHFNV